MQRGSILLTTTLTNFPDRKVTWVGEREAWCSEVIPMASWRNPGHASGMWTASTGWQSEALTLAAQASFCVCVCVWGGGEGQFCSFYRNKRLPLKVTPLSPHCLSELEPRLSFHPRRVRLGSCDPQVGEEAGRCLLGAQGHVPSKA